MKIRYALICYVHILIIVAMSGCNTSNLPSKINTETSPPATLVATPETQSGIDQSSENSPLNLPTNTPQPETQIPSYIEDIQFLTTDIFAEDVYNIDIRARSVRIGLNDEILVLGNDSDIFQLHESGEISLYASFASLEDRIEQFGIDPQGRIWVSTNNIGNYLLEENGNIRQITNGSRDRQFAFDSKGNLFTLDFPASVVNMITPDGEIVQIAQGFGEAHIIALTKNDEILIIEQNRGELLKINLDGTWEIIAENLGVDKTIAISPENQVYLFDWTGMELVDIETKVRIPITWYDTFSNSGESAVFNSKGQMFTFHPNVPIYKVDFTDQTVEELFTPDGNSFAMAVDSKQRVFIAYGSRLPTGETRIFVIDEDKTISKLLSLPYNTAHSISIMNDGRGLIEVSKPAGNSIERAVIAFDPDNGDTEVLFDGCCESHYQITQNPASGEFVWFGNNGIRIGSIDGSQKDLPFPDPGVLDGKIEISENGNVFILAFFEPTSNSQVNKKIYKLNSDYSWETMYSAVDSVTDVVDIGLCKNDEIYAMGAMTDVSSVVKGRIGISYFLWKLSESGELIPLAYDGPIDPFVVDCHTDSNSIYFTHIQGIGYFKIDD